jgi:diacylglycerol O-acyltransferase / wax synthase
VIPARHRMDSIDAAWLRMDKRTNPMIINGVWVLEGRTTLEALKRLIAERFLIHERFRSVPVEEAIGGVWVEDPYFDLDAHVGLIRLPEQAGQADLEALCSTLASTGFDARRPPWHFALVPEYGAGSAVIIRIHHCYADGIALVKVVLGMTTTTPDGEPPPPEPLAEAPHAGDEFALPWLAPLLGRATRWLGEAVAGGSGLVEAGLMRVTHPRVAIDEAKHVAGMAGELAAILQYSDDPPTPLRGDLCARKQVAWARPLPFDEVRTVAHALGCTVNDVLMSVIAGMLGRYLRGRGVKTDGLTIRASLPVNLRPPEEPASLGNRFGLVLLELPVGVAHPLKRLYAVHEAMHALKHSEQPPAAFATLAVLGSLPLVVQDLAMEILTRKASAVISNVPGPREPMYLCGQRIREQFFWVPQTGSIGLGISVLTYAGEVQFGIIADRGLIPAPHEIVDGFGAEFERLVILTVLGAMHLKHAPQSSSARACSTSRRSIASKGAKDAARS